MSCRGKNLPGRTWSKWTRALPNFAHASGARCRGALVSRVQVASPVRAAPRTAESCSEAPIKTVSFIATARFVLSSLRNAFEQPSPRTRCFPPPRGRPHPTSSQTFRVRTNHLRHTHPPARCNRSHAKRLTAPGAKLTSRTRRPCTCWRPRWSRPPIPCSTRSSRRQGRSPPRAPRGQRARERAARP